MDVHSDAVAGRLARVCEGMPTLPATRTMWFSVRVVKKAEGTSVGTQGFVHVGTLPAGDLLWPACEACNEPISAQIWGLHHVPAPTPTHTNTHMGTDVST